MAYRTFRNEATYAAPTVPNPDLTMAAIQGIGRRKERAAAEKRQKMDAAQKFKYDVEQGKFSDTQELLINAANGIKQKGQEQMLSHGYLLPDVQREMTDAQGLAKKDAIAYEKMKAEIENSSKVAADDPYTKLPVRLQKIQDAAYGEGADPHTRPDRLNSLQLGGIDEFDAEKQLQDWITKQEVEERTKGSESETQSGVHTGSDRSVAGRFLKFDPKTQKWVGGIEDKDVEAYLGSDTRVGQLFDQKITQEIAADWAKMKASGKDAAVRLALKAQNGGKEPTDQEAVDYLKVNEKENAIAPNATFGARKAMAIKAELEKGVKTKEKFSTSSSIEQDRSSSSGSGSGDKPTAIFSGSGEIITNFTSGKTGGAYTAGKVSFTDKNGVKPVAIQASVPYYDFTSGKYYGKETKEATQNISFSVADASFVVRLKDQPGKFIGAKNRTELLEKIAKSKNPENFVTDWYIKGSATDTEDDKDTPAGDEFEEETKKRTGKQDRTVGVFYGDVRDKFRAQGLEINEDDPNFKDQTGGIQEIKAAIAARTRELNANVKFKPSYSVGGKKMTHAELKSKYHYTDEQIAQAIRQGNL